MRNMVVWRLMLIGVFWLACLTGRVFGASGDVVVNEVQTSNGYTMADEDGDWSDWIEVLNRGSETVDLSGWGLSDRAANPMKWVFPQRLIGPGQRQVVFASGKDRTNHVEALLVETPEEIPGLVAWLRAEGEGLSHGAKVASWNDLSGLGNHATQTVVNAQPVFVTNTVNGRAAMRFTRSASQHLLFPVANFNGMSSLRDMTVMVVCRWGGLTPSGMFGAWGGTANSHFEINSGGQLRLRVANVNNATANSAMTVGVWSLAGGVMAGAGDNPSVKVYRDGVLKSTVYGDPGPALLSGYTHLYVGNSDSTTRCFDGDIAEVLIFNRALTALEREAAERYLAERYALPYTPGGGAQPELHANFSLDADGETVVLTRPDATTADTVAVPAVPTDTSYGRSPDGTGGFVYFGTPTPGEANTTTAYGEPVARPVFSRERGLCDAPFALTLSHPDPAVSIYYTLDGSEPAPGGGMLYGGPVDVTNTTVVRAMAWKEGAVPHRAIETHSYLFLEDVPGQTARPAGYPSNWGGFAQTSYGVSANVMAEAGATNALRTALRAVSVLSLAMSAEDMFGSGGVYANPTVDGLEKAVSAEWITNGVGVQVQADAGLRVQGGASRLFSNTPKKSMRLLFKARYGPGQLKAPVLADGGGTAMAGFNTLILRADYNNSWLHWDGGQRLRGTNARDQWVRDTQIAMSGTGSHGNHVHLFINGLYWGLYNVAERPDAAFAASYFGGEREEYDAMTHDGIRDGDSVAWQEMLAVARGGLSSQAQYEAIKQYLDVTHFADYMIANIYGGNEDWPHNNWNAVRRRAPGEGYRFYCWDGERTLEGTAANRSTVSGSNNPAEFYAALRQNAEFRLLFADRVHRHFFNGGALTPASAAERYAARAESVSVAVFGEAARWGAYRNEIYDRPDNFGSPRYGMTHWEAERTRLLDTYFPVRTATVLDQFKAANLYPAVGAPVLSPHGGQMAYGAELTVSAAQGTVYLTFDGSDPRVAYSGAVSAQAAAYVAPVAMTQAGTVKARALHNGVWSALAEAEYTLSVPERLFLPSGDGDWGVAGNWFGSVVPQGAGSRVRIGAPSADRNVNLRAPVTVGQIAFEHDGNAFRNRVRDRDTGNALTFDGGDGPACVRVTGSGVGYAEFEVAAGVVLASDLELDVRHIEGNAEYGALRLRQRWDGPGGLLKTGPGVASLTGEDKVFTGPVVIGEGVLSVTAPSAPAQAAGVTVTPGGQLRLVSASSPGVPRVYTFGGTVTLSGYGRGAEIQDSSGLGKLGALRYDPGTQSNVCVVATPVALAGEADIHVDGSQNRLELAGGVSGGARLAKTGGGTLAVGDGCALTAAVEVANGTLVFGGEAEVGALSGAGAVRIDGHAVSAVSVGGVALELVLRVAGADASANGALRAGQVSAPLGRVRIYLPEAGPRFRGGLFAAGLAAAVRQATCEVYVPDGGGAHVFDGARWRLRGDAQVTTAAAELGGVAGRVLEVRLDGVPASFGAWRAAAFTNEAERADEAVSGLWAQPGGDGVSNFRRYALGVAEGEAAQTRLPWLRVGADGVTYAFPFDPGRDDVGYVVEVSGGLAEWDVAQELFDSRRDVPGPWEDGWLSVQDSLRVGGGFYRLRLIWLGD